MYMIMQSISGKQDLLDFRTHFELPGVERAVRVKRLPVQVRHVAGHRLGLCCTVRQAGTPPDKRPSSAAHDDATGLYESYRNQ